MTSPTRATSPEKGRSAAGDPRLRPIERIPLIEEITERLVELIVQEGLKPGDGLPAERVLAEQLGVGRSTLREAVRSLRAIGVVEPSQKGMIVGRGSTTILTRPLSWGLLMNVGSGHDIMDARRVIEAGLAGMAAERATKDDLIAMEQALLAMRTAYSTVEAFAKADLAFHLAVAHAGHNFLLVHVIDTLEKVIQSWIERVAATRGDQELGWVEEHLRVFEAIRDGRANDASDAMNEHLTAAGARLIEVLREDPVEPVL